MKIFLAFVCFVWSIVLLIRMFQNIRLNQALQLKKETLGYTGKNKVSYKKSIPYLSLMVIGFVLMLPQPQVVEPSIQVANFRREAPLDAQKSILLNFEVDLVESLQDVENQDMIGTMIIQDVEYQVVIDKNQLFYLDSDGNIYENRQEE